MFRRYWKDREKPAKETDRERPESWEETLEHCALEAQ